MRALIYVITFTNLYNLTFYDVTASLVRIDRFSGKWRRCDHVPPPQSPDLHRETRVLRAFAKVKEKMRERVEKRGTGLSVPGSLQSHKGNGGQGRGDHEKELCLDLCLRYSCQPSAKKCNNSFFLVR